VSACSALSGCGKIRLEGIAQSLRDGAELYRRWYWALTDDHHRDIAAEHRQLKELALVRDADSAVDVLIEHIERAPRQLIEYARAWRGRSPSTEEDRLTATAGRDRVTGRAKQARCRRDHFRPFLECRVGHRAVRRSPCRRTVPRSTTARQVSVSGDHGWSPESA
jgi:hypothetical protein